MKKTLGGNRLGSGSKMTVNLNNYERSTHDLGYIWRSTMAEGTLVPFMNEVALPGDTFEIDLDCKGLTHPTVGPLFGSKKIQLDVFSCPIRLYQGKLQNNKMGIGMTMDMVKLPLIQMEAAAIDKTKDPDNQQINPSSIFSYLGIRGLAGGAGETGTHGKIVTRSFNAVPYLAYWDIYKNYYANKQEGKGAVIHSTLVALNKNVSTVTIKSGATALGTLTVTDGSPLYIDSAPNGNGTYSSIEILATNTTRTKESEIVFKTITNQYISAAECFSNWSWNATTKILTGVNPIVSRTGLVSWNYATAIEPVTDQPQITTFSLENIDSIREQILSAVVTSVPFPINKTTMAPYGLPLESVEGRYSKMSSQEGLALKTYQSDLFNNWLKTETIDGTSGISAITAVDTSTGKFTLDTLNLSKKVYEMLNRIAVSGGTYYDWLNAVYAHEGYRRAETPMYMGGLIKEMVFQEVVSNSATDVNGEQPLGTLAGRGTMSGKHKGGKIRIKVDEPSYIMGIVSITPRIDYSQGNKWDVDLRTMDDFHKPALDEIGFQDLITDRMAWFDTQQVAGVTTKYSAGKQPAWLNYMTNVNQVRGNFAIASNEMFMTLNRRYEIDQVTGRIKDLTTYIDPVKFNHIFAQTSRDAQNFWMQIAVDIKARRKMSAKIMPNL